MLNMLLCNLSYLQGIKVNSRKFLISKFGKNQALVVKQTIPQQKALEFSFHLAP